MGPVFTLIGENPVFFNNPLPFIHRLLQTIEQTKGVFLLIEPHGGILKESFLVDSEFKRYQTELPTLKKIYLDEIEASDLTLLANGAYSPLTGFVDSRDYHSILEKNRLASGEVWTIPIELCVPSGLEYQTGEEVALVSSENQLLGVLQVKEIFQRDKAKEAAAVFGTTDHNHPGVAYISKKGDWLLAGEIKAVKRKVSGFPEDELTPRELRQEFAERGLKTIVAFQTRNPIHRAHEYLQKVALEMVDGLLVHPLVGLTKPGDIPAEVRMECYRALLKEYYPPSRVMLSVFPAAMRYAGPKEAVFHALVRKNYGCTHFIVGRDHAGVGNYYGTYDAQNIFANFSEAEIDIKILKFENTFYCKKCGNIASGKTCPHQDGDRVFLSGTKVRELLRQGFNLPAEFTRAEVSQILMEYYRLPEAKV